MAQPTNMDELVASVARLGRSSGSKVIATLATRPYAELSTSGRTVANQYTQMVLAASMDLNSLAPEQPSSLYFQTDQWYKTHDTDGVYGGLVAYIQRAALRVR